MIIRFTRLFVQLHGSSRHALSEYGRFYNLSYASIAEQPGRRSTDLYRRNALHTPATSNSASHLQHFHIPQGEFSSHYFLVCFIFATILTHGVDLNRELKDRH